MRVFLVLAVSIVTATIPALAYAVGGCGCSHVSPKAMTGQDVSELMTDPDIRRLSQ